MATTERRPLAAIPPASRASTQGLLASLLHGGSNACLTALPDSAEWDAKFPEGSKFNEDRTLGQTPMGYVFCRSPPHDASNSLGLVTVQKDNKVILGNCHLHPRCNIRCGVAMEWVDPFRLVQWLSLGIPSKGLPNPERQRLGQAHRDLWKRTGNFGSGAAGSGG